MLLVCVPVKAFPLPFVLVPWLRGWPGGHAGPFSGLGAPDSTGCPCQPVLSVEDLIINTKLQESLPSEVQLSGAAQASFFFFFNVLLKYNFMFVTSLYIVTYNCRRFIFITV